MIKIWSDFNKMKQYIPQTSLTWYKIKKNIKVQYIVDNNQTVEEKSNHRRSKVRDIVEKKLNPSLLNTHT